MELRDLYRVSRRNPVVTKECPVCGKTFYTRRAHSRTYCSDECQYEVEKEGARLHAARWRAGLPGLTSFSRVCKNCGTEFTATSPKADYCSEKCRDEFTKTVHRCNRCGTVIEKRIGYCDKCREEVVNERKRIKTEQVLSSRREKAVEWTNSANSKCRPVSKNSCLKNRMEFSSIGIYRIDEYHCRCLRCGAEFVLTLTKGGTRGILKNRLAKNESPCPCCGTSPRGSHVYNTQESELAGMYPGFSERNVHPDWMDGLELDLYDPERRIAIEFHGLRWHSSCMRNFNSLHKRKADLCEKAGVQLIQIYASEWVQRRELVIDRLDSIMHKDMTRYFARRLSIREMNTSRERAEVNRFMDANHIQGASSAQWAVALFDGDTMVAACTFKYGTGYASGGLPEGTSKYWELNRYATKLHTSVVGGISRCIKAFARTHQDVRKIVSFADRRWTCPSRSAYASSGFVETARVEPNYLYTDLVPSHPLRNKQYMRKSSIEKRALNNPGGPEAAVFSWDKTETEMAKELGFYKVYDAGKIRYEMTL